jgi:hypothetical protein
LPCVLAYKARTVKQIHPIRQWATLPHQILPSQKISQP